MFLILTETSFRLPPAENRTQYNRGMYSYNKRKRLQMQTLSKVLFQLGEPAGPTWKQVQESIESVSGQLSLLDVNYPYDARL